MGIREEAHPKHKEEVGEDRTKERGLDKVELVLEQGNNGDDELDGVAEAAG